MFIINGDGFVSVKMCQNLHELCEVPGGGSCFEKYTINNLITGNVKYPNKLGSRLLINIHVSHCTINMSHYIFLTLIEHDTKEPV